MEEEMKEKERKKIINRALLYDYIRERKIKVSMKGIYIEREAWKKIIIHRI
jgi:hypothetical protein